MPSISYIRERNFSSWLNLRKPQEIKLALAQIFFIYMRNDTQGNPQVQ